ncbi:MAG: hypothetical protein AAF634_15275 [Bacteroidota bacterium]
MYSTPRRTLKSHLFIAFLVLIISCSQDSTEETPPNDSTVDPCENNSCQNNGTCVDGVCQCPEGFEGEFCETAVDPCEGVVCENGGNCVNGSCACPDGFEGVLCETPTDPCANVVCQNGGSCVNGDCECPDGTYGDSCEEVSSLSFQTEFGSRETLEVAINGIFAIWWSPEFDHEDDVDQMFTYLNKVRTDCLEKYGMQDPPNPTSGYFYNVYIHHGQEETVLPTYWGNGQGTDTFGMPFLTLPDGAHTDYANLSHEGFHIFQYNSNSPGYDYAGDSQWYVEASAQWYMAQNVPDEENTFIEAGAISSNPQLALWHSFSNQAPGDAIDWFFQVRQYGMHLLLYYLTEQRAVAPNSITDGFYTNTTLSPQEYLYTRIGGENFRNFFADWTARNSGGFDYISELQFNRAVVEMGLAGDPNNSNPYVHELTNSEANGTFQPADNLRPRGWSYNVIKINNSGNATYTFTLNGASTGSEGANAHFEARIIVKGNGTVRYIDMDMNGLISGTGSVTVANNETEVYLNVIAVPEHFSGNQTYNYEVDISRN